MLQAHWAGEMVELSWKPRATVFKNFLSAEECELLIALARNLAPPTSKGLQGSASSACACCIARSVAVLARAAALWIEPDAWHVAVSKLARACQITAAGLLQCQAHSSHAWVSIARTVCGARVGCAALAWLLSWAGAARPQSKPKMSKSTVVDPETGKRIPSDVRPRRRSLLWECALFMRGRALDSRVGIGVGQGQVCGYALFMRGRGVLVRGGRAACGSGCAARRARARAGWPHCALRRPASQSPGAHMSMAAWEMRHRTAAQSGTGERGHAPRVSLSWSGVQAAKRRQPPCGSASAAAQRERLGRGGQAERAAAIGAHLARVYPPGGGRPRARARARAQVRTSTGTFFGLGEHPVLRDIEQRIAAVTHLPIINGEGIQVPRAPACHRRRVCHKAYGSQPA